ncbi:hypothetical protein [Amycolatopsis sp. cmx-4-61]
MPSRFSAAVAAFFVVFSLAFAADGLVTTTVSAAPDCFRPCRF